MENTSTPNTIESFIDEIVKQAGLDDMPADFIDEYKQRLAIEAQQRMGIVAMQQLTPEGIEELNKLVEESSEEPQKISDFLVSKIDNYEELMANALRDFGREVVEKAQNMEK